MGARTCIFRVGGVIDFGQSEHQFDTASFVSIAGQTAPANGIMIRGLDLPLYNTQHVIARHLRIRNRPYTDNDYSMGLTDGLNAGDIIFDHISYGWNADDGCWCSYGAKNCTYQWVLASESVVEGAAAPGVPTGQCCGSASTDPSPPTFGGVSFLHNYWAHYFYRVPWLEQGHQVASDGAFLLLEQRDLECSGEFVERMLLGEHHGNPRCRFVAVIIGLARRLNLPIKRAKSL